MRILKLLLRTVYAIFLALDLLISAFTGGAPLETLSARFALWAEHGNWFGKFMNKWLDKVIYLVFRTPNHCEGALAAYKARVAAAPSFSG